MSDPFPALWPPDDSDNVLAEQLQQHVMQLIKVVSVERVSLPMIRTAGVEIVADILMDSLTAKMRAHLMTDHVATDVQDVYVELTNTVEVEEVDRYWKWGFWPRTRLRTQRVPVKFTGNVKVEAKYFRTFPEAQVDGYYPTQFGKSNQYVSYTHIARP